jgi:hypothetical protein
MNSMSIRLVSGTVCAILLANFIVATAYSQESKPSVVDSIRSTVNDKINDKVTQEVSGLKGRMHLSTDTLLPLNRLKAQKADLKNMLQEPGALQQQLLSKIALFDDGKFVQPGKVNASIDYTYLKDTSGMELGALNALGSVYSYNVSTGVTLFQLPVNLAFKGMNGVYSSDYTSFNKLLQFNLPCHNARPNCEKSLKSKKFTVSKRFSTNAYSPWSIGHSTQAGGGTCAG